jgi:Ca-activated chloride channel family protein
MTFQNLTWLYFAAPALLLLAAVVYWRRHFWGHPLTEQIDEELPPAHVVWRMPRYLEAAAAGSLLLALLGPVYPFTMNRVERGGLQIMLVLDLSQSMEEPIQAAASPAVLPVSYITRNVDPEMLGTPGSKMRATKTSALEFVGKRPGDAVGLVVFSNGGYLVSPATIDHESLSQYLLMMGPQTLVNEGYTAIGEGLGTANQYFEQQRVRLGRPAKGRVIVLLTDGENNTGRDPLIEIERARSERTRIYVIGVALQPGAAQGIASAVPQTGGKYYDVRNAGHLEQALTDINEIEKGVFYTLSLAANEPAYFVFVFFSLGCLALRFVLHAVPRFVEIS